MMTNRFVRSMATMALAVPLASQAVQISAGTTEAVSARNCIAGATDCDDNSAPVAQVYGGTPGGFMSTASIAVPGYGTASGSVSLSGQIGAPILHASASSEAGARMNTNSFALQRYTYDGATATTRFFGGTLTYSQSIVGTFNPQIGAGVYADIDVFTSTASTIDAGNTAESNFDAIVGHDLPGYVDLGDSEFIDSQSTSDGMAHIGVSVTLNPGEVVWVYVGLQAPAPNGTVVNASHTLVTGWDDTADLTPAATAPAVPEPSMAALFGLGVAGLLAARRRRG